MNKMNDKKQQQQQQRHQPEILNYYILLHALY